MIETRSLLLNGQPVAHFVLDAVAHLMKVQALNFDEACARGESANLILDTYYGQSWRGSKSINAALTARGL